MKVLVLLQGRNFEADLEHGTTTVGFYANRVTEAQGVDSIDQQSLFGLVKRELLATNVRSTEESRIWISKISPLENSSDRTYSGFSFYEQGWPIVRRLRAAWRRLRNTK